LPGFTGRLDATKGRSGYSIINAGADSLHVIFMVILMKSALRRSVPVRTRRSRFVSVLDKAWLFRGSSKREQPGSRIPLGLGGGTLRKISSSPGWNLLLRAAKRCQPRLKDSFRSRQSPRSSEDRHPICAMGLQ